MRLRQPFPSISDKSGSNDRKHDNGSEKWFATTVRLHSFSELRQGKVSVKVMVRVKVRLMVKGMSKG